MSVDATRWAWSVEIPTIGKASKSMKRLVLLTLADRANEEHKAFPSTKRVCADTCMDRKTVLEVIKALIEDGLIIDTGERKGATKQVRVFRLIGVLGREQTVPNTEQSQIRNSSENGTGNDPKFGTGNDPKFGTRNLKENLTKEPNNANAQKAANAQNLFEQFWTAYPNKKDKKKCEAKFKQINFSKHPFDKIMAALELFKQSQAWTKDNGQYIPMPTTWLNGERWNDELAPAVVITSTAANDSQPTPARKHKIQFVDYLGAHS